MARCWTDHNQGRGCGMSNQDVIDLFLNGTDARSGNLSSLDGVLYSYLQPIAAMRGRNVLINATRFSTTTSAHTGRLRRAISRSGRFTTFDVALGSCSAIEIKQRLLDLVAAAPGPAPLSAIEELRATL